MSLFDMETILHIPVDSIKTDVQLKNIRTVFNEEKIQELASSIYNEGLMTPLIIMDSYDESNNDITELVAGARRLRAIKHIRNELDSTFMDSGVPCIQFEGTHHDAVFASAEENIAREEVDEVDIAQWIFDRVEEGISQTEISNRIHKSLQYVSFRYNFHTRAADEVKEALRCGMISFSAAYELTKNLEKGDQVKWINKAKDLESKISLADARVAGKPKSTKPSAKARNKMLARAAVCAEDRGSEIAKGMSLAISWVDGLITNDDMEQAIAKEEN